MAQCFWPTLYFFLRIIGLLCSFTKLLQIVLSYDKIQDTILSSDKILSILISGWFLCCYVYEF